MEATSAALGPRFTLSARGLLRAAAWPVSVLIIMSHVAWGDPDFPLEALLCGGLLGAFALLACTYSTPGTLPIIAIQLVRLYFALAFPMFSPLQFTTVYGPVRMSSRAIVSASLASLLFVACFLVVALVASPVGRRLGRPLTAVLDRKGNYSVYDTVAVRCLVVFLLAVNLISNRYSASDVFGPFAFLATTMGTVELPIVLLFWDAHKTGTVLSRALAWSAVATTSIIGLASGFLGAAVSPWIVAGAFMWSVTRRMPTWIILGSLAVGLILNPAKHTYRRLSWWGPKTDVTFVERAENWGTALAATYSGSGSDYGGGYDYDYDQAATGIAARLSTLKQIVHMFEWVPGRVPHAGSRAWFELPLSFIPRVFWPDKPALVREYNHTYAILFRIHSEKIVKTTTITLPSVGDGYWRLGWFGVAFEGAVIGLINGLVHGMASLGSRALLILGIGFALGAGAESHALGLLSSLPRVWLVLISILALAEWLPALYAGARSKGKYGSESIWVQKS